MSEENTADERRAGRIYDALAAAPDGLDIRELAYELGEEQWTVRPAIRTLRVMLADNGDTISVPAIKQGGGLWKYKLVTGHEDTQEWVANRVGDAETRMETIELTMQSVVEAESIGEDDALYVKAKKIHRTLAYLRAELSEIDTT